MKTVKCKTPAGKTRYYLADESGAPVQVVLNYLKFRDNQGLARNTLRLNCYQLQSYFTYLSEAGTSYDQISIDDLAEFMAWLRNPLILTNLVRFSFEPAHKEQTINETIDTVINFYEYLARSGEFENRLSEKLVKFVMNPGRHYKGFLYGIADNRPVKSNVLRMPVPQREIRRINKEETISLLDACTNIRDYFLLYLLFETGMRIGEALSLWLEDFGIDDLTISITDRGELENLAEIKTVHSPRKIDCTQTLADLFVAYVCEIHTEEIDTNHIYRLIFDEDIPRKERLADTYEKIRYIPGSVIVQIDANVSAIEPERMQPLYVLLRESGWRGTDILNLRYDNCLDYVWNKAEERYIPYLCGEITKTGIPVLKIPIREDVADMLEDLIKDAKAKSNEINNPHKYLFNTYEGTNMGLPYNRKDFADAVQDMIRRKDIRDADGSIYHFKVHSLRHTRASEYAEQGMPIGVIQKLLGHCSLQMTLHYAKASEDLVYRKWKESTELGSLHLGVVLPGAAAEYASDTIHYEKVNKGLDAVKVPFGVCFKPSKLACRTQLKHCLECANFCSSHENETEYREEIRRVGELIAIAKRLDRKEWIDKNEEYLQLLLAMLDRITAEGVVHKSGALREGSDA